MMQDEIMDEIENAGVTRHEAMSPSGSTGFLHSSVNPRILVMHPGSDPLAVL